MNIEICERCINCGMNMEVMAYVIYDIHSKPTCFLHFRLKNSRSNIYCCNIRADIDENWLTREFGLKFHEKRGKKQMLLTEMLLTEMLLTDRQEVVKLLNGLTLQEGNKDFNYCPYYLEHQLSDWNKNNEP